MIPQHGSPEQPPIPEPLVCRRCGAITAPLVTPGTGPHAFKANCPECGRFMRWVSRFSPEEQIQCRPRAKQDALARIAPTARQLDLLRTLRDTQPQPANTHEASVRIDALKDGRRLA